MRNGERVVGGACVSIPRLGRVRESVMYLGQVIGKG